MKGACPPLLELTKVDNEAAVVAACSTLGTLASVGTNSDIIRESGGIERLMELLPCGGDDGNSRAVSLAAVQALCSLLLFSDQNRTVREAPLLLPLPPMRNTPQHPNLCKGEHSTAPITERALIVSSPPTILRTP